MAKRSAAGLPVFIDFLHSCCFSAFIVAGSDEIYLKMAKIIAMRSFFSYPNSCRFIGKEFASPRARLWNFAALKSQS